MSLLYPRTISIRRTVTTTPTTQQGSIGFGGVSPKNETVVASNLACSIQYERVGRESAARLPTDTRRSTWLILLPISSSPLGLVNENDVAVDDLGKRYQIYAADWQPTGYNLHCELLTV